jgi:hypothetical protein
MWLGVLLVLTAVVVGAKVMAAADDTQQLWAADRDIPAGTVLTSADVHRTRVHFTDDTARRYLTAAKPFPSGSRLVSDVAAGDLVPRSALADAGSAPALQLPLGVTAAGIPAGLAVGDHVDVWVAPSPTSSTSRGQVTSRRILSDVVVASLGEQGLGGLTTARQVLVSLDSGTDVASVLDAVSGASVVLVRLGG